MFRAIGYLTLFLFLASGLHFLIHYLPYMVESYGPEEILLYGYEAETPKNATRKLEYLNKLV